MRQILRMDPGAGRWDPDGEISIQDLNEDGLKSVVTEGADPDTEVEDLATACWEVGVDPGDLVLDGGDLDGDGPVDDDPDDYEAVSTAWQRAVDLRSRTILVDFEAGDEDDLDEDGAVTDRELSDSIHWYIRSAKRSVRQDALLDAEQERSLAREVQPLRHYRRLEKAAKEKVGDEADFKLIAVELVWQLVCQVANAAPVLWAIGLWTNLPMGATLAEALEDPDLRMAIDSEPDGRMVSFIADVLNVDEKDVGNRLTKLSLDISILPQKVLVDHGHRALRSFPETLDSIRADLTKGLNPFLYAWSFREMVSQGEEARNKLVEANLRLVCKSALEYGRRLQRMDRVVDLIGEGNLGLLQAAENFDPCRGTRFSTYATKCIQTAIRRFISEQFHAVKLRPEVTREMSAVTRTRQQLLREPGREPSPEELARVTGKPLEQILQLLGTSSLAQPPQYLSQPVCGGAEGTVLADTLRDRSPSVEDQVCDAIMDESRVQEMRAAVAALPERQRQVMRLLYFSPDGQRPTLETVGQELGISRQRVHRLEKEAMEKLQSRLNSSR